MSNRDISSELIDTIAAQGFSVYLPTSGRKTYLFFTDGTRIGYLQTGDFGGLDLSTVHIPNKYSGIGFKITDDSDSISVPTREVLERAFWHAPSWASTADREATIKWRDMKTFLASRTTVPLELVREAQS